MADNNFNARTSDTRKRWEERYGAGNIPWDTQVTPPEVIDFWQDKRRSRVGIALDLGCGPGTNIRYLAELGLTAIGVEIASPPLITAQRRFGEQSKTLLSYAHLVCSDVCLLPFSGLNAIYILDIGCLHSMPRPLRSLYAQGVVANIAPAGFYHLFAFDADPDNPEPESGPPGMANTEVAQLFSPHLTLVEETIARPDRRPCRWYLLQRPK